MSSCWQWNCGRPFKNSIHRLKFYYGISERRDDDVMAGWWCGGFGGP